jgi:capsule biosynthesis phosphatase
MNIIIPIGGIGKRFTESNYTLPKPLIKTLGKSLIIRCIESLKIGDEDTVYIAYRSELDRFNFKDIITNSFNYNFKFVPINFDTRGAAETTLVVLDKMTDNELENQTLIIDSDNIYNDDVIGEFKKNKDNTIFFFEDKNTTPLFSYIEIKNNSVTKIEEKNKISDNACCGVYGFRSGLELRKFTVDVIKNNNKSNNEFYVSSIYKKMIESGILILPIKINNHLCLGTPDQLKSASSNIETKEKLRFCFDLDNTLVTYPKIKSDYTTVEPIKENIEFLKFLKSLGHTIIVYTARRMRTHNGDVGKVTKDIGIITLNTLNDLGIPYDEIYFGKPYANYYIDDLAVRAYDDLEKELGFYHLHPSTRSHNQITIKDNKIIKISEEISGEKFWYENIPENIKGLFPEILESDENSITISKINGIPISYLNITKTLNKNIIIKILETINIIHKCEKNINEDEKKINIYSNYTEKLKKRIEDFNFNLFENSTNLVEEITLFFERYESSKSGKIGVIHGDPVFTNILIDNMDNLKFIDMRGKLGKVTTIYGDIFYDYSKIYQSIIGYDFILMDKDLDVTYINSNKKIFEEYIINNFGRESMENIKYITKSLLFTLIPIHNNQKCIDYYNLINKI